jgi:hypothetical protein
VLRVLIAVAALGAAGCGGVEVRDDGAAVESLVLETCAPQGDPAADPVCRCAYERVVEQLGAEGVERLDQQLRSDPDSLPDDLRRIVLDCAFDQIDPTPPTTDAAP